jgi:hypothetical protein
MGAQASGASPRQRAWHARQAARLKKFLDRGLGKDAWQRLLAQAEQERKLYTPVKEYADDELMALVATASQMTGRDVKSLLTDFGRFMIPDLLPGRGLPGGNKYFTAIYPDPAVSEACVSCHNGHKDSPRDDFKLGDVMGAVIIRIKE